MQFLLQPLSDVGVSGALFFFITRARKISEKRWDKGSKGGSASCTFPLIGMLHSVMRAANALFVGRVQTASTLQHDRLVVTFLSSRPCPSCCSFSTPSLSLSRRCALPTKISNRLFRNFHGVKEALFFSVFACKRVFF